MSAIAVLDYLGGVRRALGDLPPAELNEVMAELEGHLAAVVEEDGGAPTAARLAERLGSPETYAAELRAAAGYESRAQPRSPVDEPNWRRVGVFLACAFVLAVCLLVIGFAILFGGGRAAGYAAVVGAAGLVGAVSQLRTRRHRTSVRAGLDQLRDPAGIRRRWAPASPSTGTSS